MSRNCKALAILVAYSWASPMTFASVCDDPGKASYASVEFVGHDTSALDREPATTAQDNQNLEVIAHWPGAFVTGFSHRYTRFNFERIELQTNAHLHTTSFALHWRSPDMTFRAALAPTLSASSNVLGHPRKYRSDTVQFPFAFAWQRPLARNVRLNYGLCGDHRLGEYRLYPAMGIGWRPGAAWDVELGFPRTRIRYRIRRAVEVGVMAAPDGSEWHVMDRDFARESRFLYKAYAIEGFLRLEPTSALSVTASFGRQIGSRFEMTLQSGERAVIDGEDVSRAGVEVRWQF